MKHANTLTDIEIFPTSRVLVFMPHPDDEAVFASGLLQKISKTNPNIKVITVTAGEKSTLRFGLTPDQDLATARRSELATALSILGISDHEVWNISDGEIESSTELVQANVKKEILHYQPTHLITFEPDGIYGHPDHISLSQIVTKLCLSPIKLLYVTVCPHYIFPSAKKMAKKSTITPLKPTYKLKLSPRESINKIRALKAHRSQFKIDPFNPTIIIQFLINDMLLHEYFTYQLNDVTIQ